MILAQEAVCFPPCSSFFSSFCPRLLNVFWPTDKTMMRHFTQSLHCWAGDNIMWSGPHQRPPPGIDDFQNWYPWCRKHIKQYRRVRFEREKMRIFWFCFQVANELKVKTLFVFKRKEGRRRTDVSCPYNLIILILWRVLLCRLFAFVSTRARAPPVRRVIRSGNKPFFLFFSLSSLWLGDCYDHL